MQPYGNQLRDYYQRELTSLREDTDAFARAHPAEASALGLGRTGARDAHVEMLVQAFAFLTGRVLYEMESSKAVLANALVQDLYPHMAAPLPCMAVAQVQVLGDAANGALLDRGRQASAIAVADDGHRVACRFRTTTALPLVPLAVVESELLQPEGFPEHIREESTLSALRVRVVRLGADPIKALKNRRLRFYIDAAQKHAFLLQEMLAVHLSAVTLQRVEDGEVVPAPPAQLQWLGFGEDEAALPARANMHPGHRLLQEYFALPDKFMFFELPPLDVAGLAAGFDLFFHFRVPVAQERQLSATALRLNCVPLVNLYPQRIDPLPLDHTRYEYRLHADVQGHAHCEIYALQELTSVRADGTLRELRPYFELESSAVLHAQDYYYALRRQPDALGEIAGTEAFISFLDNRLQPVPAPPEVIGGRALCTNRRLPEKMLAGQALALEGPGPVRNLELTAKPSPHDTPTLLGSRPWLLASQLSLNHLSLAEGPQALSALKHMLRAHVGPSQSGGLLQIDGLRLLQCRQVLRPLVREGLRALGHALHVRLTFDRMQFEAGSVVLFASVLRHFLAAYASVNTLVEVSVATSDAKGTLVHWPALCGSEIVL